MSENMICDTNLSHAWARAFCAAHKRGNHEIVPLLVTVTDIADDVIPEDERIGAALCTELEHHRKPLPETVANTIFPLSLWNPAAHRRELFGRYMDILPSIKSYPANRNGVYFERLISFDSGNKVTNQLEHIITTYTQGNHRRSSMQASVFNPALDHTNQRQRGFPCLQHVFFTPMPGSGLAVSGVYATQYLFEKAYGNYVGLCRLGAFMAHELGLRLRRMSCYAAVAKLGDSSAGELSALAAAVAPRHER